MKSKKLVISTIVAGLVAGSYQLVSSNAFADHHEGEETVEKNACSGPNGCHGKDHATHKDKKKMKKKKKNGKKDQKHKEKHHDEAHDESAHH